MGPTRFALQKDAVRAFYWKALRGKISLLLTHVLEIEGLAFGYCYTIPYRFALWRGTYRKAKRIRGLLRPRYQLVAQNTQSCLRSREPCTRVSHRIFSLYGHEECKCWTRSQSFWLVLWSHQAIYSLTWCLGASRFVNDNNIWPVRLGARGISPQALAFAYLVSFLNNRASCHHSRTP